MISPPCPLVILTSAIAKPARVTREDMVLSQVALSADRLCVALAHLVCSCGTALACDGISEAQVALFAGLTPDTFQGSKWFWTGIM